MCAAARRISRNALDLSRACDGGIAHQSWNNSRQGIKDGQAERIISLIEKESRTIAGQSGGRMSCGYACNANAGKSAILVDGECVEVLAALIALIKDCIVRR